MKKTITYLFTIAFLFTSINAQTDTGISNLASADKNVNQQDSEKRNKIKIEILKAKEILENDNGKLWGEKIWNDNLLIIDFDNTIYSLKNLPASNTDDDILFYKKIPANTLSFANTTQTYENEKYATVLVKYLDDESSTIIHELFHLLQFSRREFNGNQADYLDKSEARKLLRLEFQALRNTLQAIDDKRSRKDIRTYFKDALVFRKIRQSGYKEFLSKELEIETLEGIANYTGFALSAYHNKYQKAIKEINLREQAQTYTRPFPYATGPAYGLILDYLNVSWKKGLNEVYSFSDIYEKQILKEPLKIKDSLLKSAQRRSNYEEINKQEIQRLVRQKALVDYYTKMFVGSLTLKVKLTDLKYSRSFNMNGTLILSNKGTVYSSIKGTDRSGGKNFGDFSTIEGKNELGVAGVLGYENNGEIFFEFPLPKIIEGNRIAGDFYEITLNENWKIIKEMDGNMSIVKKE